MKYQLNSEHFRNSSLAFFPFFDQLCPVLIWSILNREICSNKDIGSAIEICPDLYLKSEALEPTDS